MKILVPIKRVVDYNVKIRVKSDESGIETAGVKMSMNPFDEIAVEEALRLKEKGLASEVVVVSLGEDAVQETLRTALAMGADRAIHVALSASVSSLQVAKLLCVVTQEENPSLIIMGKQAIDDDASQTGPMLAALLNWGQGTFASQVVLDKTHVTVTREVDGGHMTVKLALPAVVTTDLRLNEPRYVTLPNIMKARSKPIARKVATDMGVNITPHVIQQKIKEPPKRKAGIKVANVAALIDALKHEAKVL